MYSNFVTLGGRRALLREAATLVSAARLAGSSRARGDAQLFAACHAFNVVEQEKQRLLAAGGEEDEVLARYAAFCGRQETHLERMCDLVATTLPEHRARALSYALWDAGELAYRARVGGTPEDLILNAMVRDLTDGRGQS